MHRESFNNDFNPDYLPDWECPVCLKGYLHSTDKSVKLIESTKSKRLRDNYDDWYEDMVEGTFTGFLTCNNKSCNEPIIFSGLYFVDMESNADGTHIEPTTRIKPHYFRPALYILPYKNYHKPAIEKALMNSYDLFWIGNAACANAIRKVVEVIMDDKGVNKIRKISKAGKTKLQPLSLHDRIKLFEQTNPDVGEMLLATKWIGNEGSHALDILTRDHILDAYQMLEVCLDKMYNKVPAILKKTAKSINKAKGVSISKKKLGFGIR